MAATIAVVEEKPQDPQSDGASAAPAEVAKASEEKTPDIPLPEADDEEEDSEKISKEYEDVVIESEQLGIYHLLLATSKGRRQYQKSFEELKAAIPHLVNLFRDIYYLAPSLFICVMIWNVWTGLEDALLMQLSTRMLRLIEAGLTSGTPFVSEVLWALGLRTACSIIMSYLQWKGRAMESRLRGLVTNHFELSLMEVRVRLDMPTSLDASSKIDVSGSDAWSAFQNILSYLTSMLTAASQIMVISNQARASGDPLFVLICVLKPVFSSLSYRALWEKVCYAYVNNQDYLRMSSLKALANDEFKEDVLSGDLGAWIINEYRSARDKVGEISSESPFTQYYLDESVLKEIASSVLNDIPLVYCGLNAVLCPSRFSIASLAIFQSSFSALRYSIETLFRNGQQFRENLQSIKQTYSTKDIRNKIHEGKVSYAPSASTSEEESPGMSFELKDLTFAYPGSKKKTCALDKINLTIPGGSLVVIVGSNGSGKSTIVRILSRLFEPTSGQLLIDDRPAQDYHLSDLRQATTLLSQDNKVYPLSFAENIGLGSLDSVHDMEAIKKAAEQGGATEFISKLDTGFDTQLKPYTYTVSMNLYGKEGHPLKKQMDKLEKEIKISGGETQRLVAARSFMRFNSGKIKFVVVDEPSSALDAEGEVQLFNNLLAVRKGKTMVFVTHRFGHLTKFADTIICMKDGKIAETGSHDELMRKDGEYSKLYNIQANAFSDSSAPVADTE